MKKLILIIFCFCIVMMGCSEENDVWSFNKPFSDVKEISIIYAENFSGADEFINADPLKKIDNQFADELYTDVMSLNKDDKIMINHSNPSGYYILLYYGDKEYCVVSEKGSGYIYYDNENDTMVYEYGKIDFDESDFEILINKYLE